MNGICLIWSRGRLISPSLPVGDDRYMNLILQKRPTRGKLGGNRLVRRSGTNIQTMAAAAPKLFFLMSRCLKGRNVACVRSKEIAPRLINDAIGEPVRKITIKKVHVSRKIDRPKVTHDSQKTTQNEDAGPNKHISNCLVDHQVHAALAKTAIFQVNNDCKAIQHHHSSSLHSKHC